jgi:Flp pilus assembly protein TadG
MRPIRRRSDQRGAMLMELALVFPFLILILMIVLEGSRVVRAHQVLNNAAREGARLSILVENQSPSGITAIQNAVVAYAAANHIVIQPTDVTVNQAFPVAVGATTVPGSQVTVSYFYTLNYLSIFEWLGVPGTYTLTGRVVFQNFQIGS